MAVRRLTPTKRKPRFKGNVKKRRQRKQGIVASVFPAPTRFSLTPIQLQQLHEFIRHIRLEIDKFSQTNQVENLRHLRTTIHKMEQFVREVDISQVKLTSLIILFEPTLHTLNQNPIPLHLLTVQLQSLLHALFVFFTSPTFIHNQIIMDIQELLALLLRIHVRIEVLEHEVWNKAGLTVPMDLHEDPAATDSGAGVVNTFDVVHEPSQLEDMTFDHSHIPNNDDADLEIIP